MRAPLGSSLKDAVIAQSLGLGANLTDICLRRKQDLKWVSFAHIYRKTHVNIFCGR